MTKRLTLLLVLSFLFINSCKKEVVLTPDEKSWLKENKGLKVSVFGYYPPYQFKNEYGDVDGVFIDYLQLIESKIDYKFSRVEYVEWSNLIEDAKTGKLNLILEIQKTKERSKYLNFYSDIFNAEQMLVTRKDDVSDISFNNVENKNIVLPKGYAIIEHLKNKFPRIQISTEINEEACLKALNEGKYDAYIGPKPNSHYYIQNRHFTNLEITSSKTSYNYKPSIAVKKSNVILSNIIKKVDKSITLNEREVIFNNWLLKKSFPIYHQLKFWLILLPFIIFIIFVILFYNRRLKNQVETRTKELQIALVESEKSDDIKTNFIQNISHEIRTPMNGILGYSELLRKDNITQLEQSQYIDIIVDSGKNLVRIIDNILEVSNLQTNETNSINEEVTSLNEVFENLVSFFKPKALNKELQIVYKKHNLKEGDLIVIDKLKLIKILKKIINNAITFTSKGFVEISYIKNKNNLEIKVVDTGIGIENNQKEIIFDSFFQLENKISKKFSGLGLGLTIAKKNALILGGEITFVSEEGKGSTFFIKLPFKPVSLSPSKEESVLKENKNNTYQILVAEDEEINFMLVNSVLSKFEPYNFLITRAENGVQAVDICKENQHIDLVLMDIRMPLMDGYKATSKIKEFRPELPIIAHTAYSTDKDILYAYQAGCDNVISKPININNFEQTILNHIKLI